MLSTNAANENLPLLDLRGWYKSNKDSIPTEPYTGCSVKVSVFGWKWWGRGSKSDTWF